MPKMILVKETPTGQAPEHVRRAWLGLKIPLSENQSGGYLRGALGGEPETENLNGYCVDASKAIEALEAVGQKEAAYWWHSHGYGFGNERLTFGKAFCDLLDE